LANYFIHTYQGTGEHYTLSSEALHKLQEYDWPGNIRELENVIQRALCFTSAGVLQPEDLHIDTLRASTPINESAAPKAASKAVPAYESFRQMQLEQEREFLIKTIRECNGSVREAAQKLGLFRTALYNRLNHLGVNIKEVGSRK
jgi:DNA-binding NtrC family response regulator